MDRGELSGRWRYMLAGLRSVDAIVFYRGLRCMPRSKMYDQCWRGWGPRYQNALARFPISDFQFPVSLSRCTHPQHALRLNCHFDRCMVTTPNWRQLALNLTPTLLPGTGPIRQSLHAGQEI